jgi:hypothetical protein
MGRNNKCGGTRIGGLGDVGGTFSTLTIDIQ